MPTSKVRFPVDAEAAFRSTQEAEAGGAVAGANVESGAINVDRGSAYWQDGQSSANDHEIAIFVVLTESLAGGADIQVQVTNTADDWASPDVLSEKTGVRDSGIAFIFAIPREDLLGKAQIRVVANAADGSSGVEFYAYAAPIRR